MRGPRHAAPHLTTDGVKGRPIVFTRFTSRKFIIRSLAAIAVATGLAAVAAFAGLNLGGGGNGASQVAPAAAHEQRTRYLAEFNIPRRDHGDPRGTRIRVQFQAMRNGSLGTWTVFGSDPDREAGAEVGCAVIVPSTLNILVPNGATTVTIPGGNTFSLKDAHCKVDELQGVRFSKTADGNELTNVRRSYPTSTSGDFDIDLSSTFVSYRYVDEVHEHAAVEEGAGEGSGDGNGGNGNGGSGSGSGGNGNGSGNGRQSGGVMTGVTGLGFYCVRHYAWRDIARDASFPIFLTAARRSLVGWVFADASGGQVALCVGHRPIFRPDDQ